MRLGDLFWGSLGKNVESNVDGVRPGLWSLRGKSESHLKTLWGGLYDVFETSTVLKWRNPGLRLFTD